jgi:hypothetical protein
MMRGLVLFFAVGCACILLLGFDWPMAENAVIMNFCQSTGDDYRTGIVISGNDAPVHPIADGDLVFSYEEGKDYSSVPFGLGSFCAMYHEGGIQSVYSHLKKGSVKRDSVKLRRSDVLGMTGNTGSSLGNNVFLQIFNIEDDEILNPVRNLRPLPGDVRPPVITGVFLRRNGEMISAETSGRIEAGEYEIFVSAYDPQDDAKRRIELAPYRVFVSNNGNEIANITLQALEEKDGNLVSFKSEKPHSEMYASHSSLMLGVADLVEGKNYIQVIASDFAGNQCVKEILLEAVR